METGHVADGDCDDVANTEICNWDGGDCCGPNRVIDYCTECQCHETTTPTPTTTAPTTTAAAAITTAATTITTGPCDYDGGDCCPNPNIVGDAICHDKTNNLECNYDGGDCCGPAVSCKYFVLFTNI